MPASNPSEAASELSLGPREARAPWPQLPEGFHRTLTPVLSTQPFLTFSFRTK